jgi:hypothetical protein
VEQHRAEQDEAERPAHQEARRDRDAVEERVDAEPGEPHVPDRRVDQGVVVDLLPEVEVRRERVLGEVHQEVADQDVEVDVRPLLQALGHHPEEGHGEHEPGAERQEVLEKRPVPVAASGHEGSADDVGESGNHAQDQGELTRRHADDPRTPLQRRCNTGRETVKGNIGLPAPRSLR